MFRNLYIGFSNSNFSARILLLFELIIQALTFTFVLSALAGYTLSLFFDNFNIEVWVMLVFGIFILTSFIIATKNVDDLSIEYENRNITTKYIFLKYLPYLIFLPSIIMVFYSTRYQMSFHGPFHSGYVNQIVNGTIPPENVVLPGFGANIYWLYHSLIAIIVRIFNIPAPLASSILNIFTLVGALYWINKILVSLDLKYRNPFIISCYAIFIMCGLNLFSSIHFLINYSADGNIFPDNFLASMYRENTILIGDQRLSNLFRKFLNFNGFPIGVLYFSSTLYYFISISDKSLNLRNILLLMISLAGALIFHATTGVFILVSMPLALIITIAYSHKNNIRELFLRIKLSDLAIFLIACSFFLPIFHYIYVAAKALPADPTIASDSAFALKSIFASTYPLWALALIGFYYYKKKIGKSLIFLIIAILLGYILSILVHMPDYNEYKFIYLATILLSLMVIILLDRAAYLSNQKRISTLKILLALLLILPLVNIFYVNVNAFKSVWLKDKTYYYEGKAINIRNNEPYKESYVWIKQNTPLNTVVIAPYENKNDSRIYTVAERLPYVVYGHFFANGIKEYHDRVDNVQRFYDVNVSADEKINILNDFKKFSTERETVIFVPKENVDEVLLNDKVVELLSSSDDVNIYKFQH